MNVKPTSLARIVSSRVVVVIRAPTIDDPVALSRSLSNAGIGTVEITLTTAGALDAIEQVAALREVQVGAGTVLEAAQARDALSAGADFLVSPTIELPVREIAREAGALWIPGTFTPNEVREALRLGSVAIKLFPGRAIAPAYLRDLRSVFPEAGLIPSGAVSIENARAYMDAGAIAVSSGTATAPPDLVASGDYEEIGRRAEHLLSTVAV